MSPRCERGRVPGDGISLAYAYWAGEGEPIVAIHGASANAFFYVGIADRLGGRRPLLSLDLRGRGNTDKPEGPYGMVQHARDVALAMDARGIDRAVIVGHSLGASVAVAFAEDFPDRCAAVVLYDGGPVSIAETASDPGAIEEFLESARPIEMRMTMTFPSRREYYAYWQKLPVFDPEQWGPWVEAYLDYDLGGPEPELRPKCSLAALAADAQDLLAFAGRDPAGSVRAPVLVLCADHGLIAGTRPLISDHSIEAMAEQYPSFWAERLPATNHYTIALADPAATIVAERLVTFAASCGM
jgi:pimeloyl-ACP methyl ester carboxylesterase